MTDQNVHEKSAEEFKRQADEYLAGWKRAKADLVNYQKQVERERAEWFMYANAGCARAMLPVLDSLEGAVLHNVIPAEAEIQGSPIKSGMTHSGDDGLLKIRDQMLEVLKQMGVEAISVVKEPPNPELHEVVGTEKVEGVTSGLMAREVQRGYTLHGKVLRAAKVVVAE